MKRKIIGSILAVLLTATVVYAASWKTTDTEDSSVNGGEIVMVEDEGGTDNNWMSLTTIKTWVLNALSAASVSIVDSGSNYTATNVETALAEVADELDGLPTLTWGTGLTDISNTISVTYPVSAEAFSGSGWNGDTGGLTRNDAYDYVHLFDTDDDGLVDKLDLSSAGYVYSSAAGAISSKAAAAASDINTGTDADKPLTSDALAGSNLGSKELGWVVVDSDTATAVADSVQPIVVPSSLNGMNLVDVTCSVADLNSAASGTTTVVLRRLRGATAADMTSTGVTIDYSAYTASDETVDTSNDDVATGDLIFADINAITTAAQKGLSCSAVFRLP